MTGKRCPELQGLFASEAKRLDQTHECLVHGDYSPKNIMIAGDRMVVLDCEVANYGDPAFDYCFLINHLLLKGLYHLPDDVGSEHCVREFRERYRMHCGLDEDLFRDFSVRAGRLLAMLMLARVDGKSPVEYLHNEGARQRVRDFVNTVLQEKQLDDTRLVAQWFEHLWE
jgi:aminoglycoside phosphotransferase (APT) family kinase protein